jgi:hypothetical protein
MTNAGSELQLRYKIYGENIMKTNHNTKHMREKTKDMRENLPQLGREYSSFGFGW